MNINNSCTEFGTAILSYGIQSYPMQLIKSISAV